jgi:hypothetical protein
VARKEGGGIGTQPERTERRLAALRPPAAVTTRI